MPHTSAPLSPRRDPLPPSENVTTPAEEAVALADRLLKEALEHGTAEERARSEKMARMVRDPAGKEFAVRLADEVFRSRSPRVSADRFRRLAEETGLPAWTGAGEKLLLRAGLLGSRVLPSVVMPAVEGQLRRDSAEVILPGEPDALHRYLDRREAEGARVNVNQLGEAVLGDAEAAHRMEAILGHLADPAVTYISVKISAVFAGIHPLDREGTLTAVRERLRALYRAAMAVSPAKFVNLDMEEYQDLDLTVEAFTRTLEEPEFTGLYAGLVLQAYLPDSWDTLRELTDWARRRTEAGGARIKVRLVKGANLAMERVEAEMHGWEAAPYGCKEDGDANFIRMLEYALMPENAAGVQVGVGSHNLFHVALALVLARRNGTAEHLELEMLEGMANHQARAVLAEAGGLLVYAPVVKRPDFLSAMAYLVRRLDENTTPGNFLRDLFSMRPGSAEWMEQEARFRAAWADRDAVSSGPRRTQDRTAETRETHAAARRDGFQNEPDTDWTLPANREWADRVRREWMAREPEVLPIVGDGAEGQTVDPGRPGRVVCRYPLAGPADVARALDTAVAALPEWAGRSVAERGAVLQACGDVIAARRGEFIGAMMLETGKAAVEGDVEVSEAVDFARYYAGAFAEPGLEGAAHEPLGVVVITPPWNFPFAIPCGGVLAALMAGNTVILKPAPEAVLTAWCLARALWDAGVPRGALLFLPCPDDDTGKALLTDRRTAAVILTGAWETARLFRGWKPEMRLHAETSGKNAMIITAQSDRDLAVKDLVKSAFGHAGQKCSAASLAILEAEVYDDPAFRRQLRDAAASLRAGAAWDPGNVVTPVIREPGPALLRALTTLEPGEEWLLEPEADPANPNAWTPGIRLGVNPGSWFHRTECFGPVLGLMRAANLEEAVRLQNDSEYGLTAGMHSLDSAEIALWRDRVEAGNLYINRPITGAIVRRQPFGGWKRSGVGPCAKAGGPNYVYSLCSWRDEPGAEPDYEAAWTAHFAHDHDPSGLGCESNVFRYRRSRGVVLRLAGVQGYGASAIRAAHAARVSGVTLHVSAPPSAAAAAEFGGIPVTLETEEALAARVPSLNADTLRTLTPPGAALTDAAFAAGWRWIDAPLVSRGRVELTRWMREQAVTETRHRYGNLFPPGRP